ncbi:MAG: exodeoxyribonuclease VII small subunit [Eubacteriales bacterium]|nr:exodeoxyribonuclease VII small subunit [Eubacteriales bacterium]
MCENKKQGEERGIREVFEELDQIAARLEDRETSLEDSFQLYRKGMELLKECGDRLDTVEKKMLEISEDGSFREFSK